MSEYLSSLWECEHIYINMIPTPVNIHVRACEVPEPTVRAAGPVKARAVCCQGKPPVREATTSSHAPTGEPVGLSGGASQKLTGDA